MFNYGHMYFYLVESLNEIEQNGVDSRDENDGDNEMVGDTVTAKPLRKGRRYVTSGFIEDLQDNQLIDGTYVLRAHVHRSYKWKSMLPLTVTVFISGTSGSVIHGKCACASSYLNRCGHVTSLLLYLSDTVTKFGYIVVAPTALCVESRKKTAKRSKTHS